MRIKNKDELTAKVFQELMNEITLAHTNARKKSEAAKKDGKVKEAQWQERVMIKLSNIQLVIWRLRDLCKDPRHAINDNDYWLYKASMKELQPIL